MPNLKKKRFIIFTVTTFLLMVLLIFTLLVFLPFRKDNYKEAIQRYYNNVIQSRSFNKPPGWDVVEKYTPYDFVLCRFGLENIEIVFYSTMTENEYYRVEFYQLERSNIFSQKWEIPELKGITTVNNTTFSELQSMLQQDCLQFQKANFKDYNEYRQKLDNGEIVWGFREAEPVEQPPTLEEQYPDSESRQARIQEIEEILLEGEQYLQEFEEIIQNSQDPEEIESFKLNKEQVKESIKEYEAELEQLKGRE